jgi:hippurate hydrolase
VSSSSDSIEITFKGRGGHGSAPDQAIDPITIASRFIVDVQTLVSREKDPKAFGVVTFGAISGGTVGNIIPDNTTVLGTIRAYDNGVRAKLVNGVSRVAKASAMVANAPEPEIKLGIVGEAVINDNALVERTEKVLKGAFGEKAFRMPAMTASEDFSAFGLEGVPSMFFFTGVYPAEQVEASKAPGGKPLAFNHSPFYAPVPEPSIKTGIEAMSLAVLNVMAK